MKYILNSYLTGVILFLLNISSYAQTLLPIPDTLVGPNYVLNMHEDSVQFFAGNKSYTKAYNQYAYLGPTLIFNKGESISITVNNQLNDTTTVHWHGIHVPAGWDGGPHTPILPGATWNPQFTVMDNAATYWYHPHTHMKTALQAIQGAAGLIIVRDSIEASLALPRTYGVDDIPLVIQCQQYDSLNQAMPLGMQDSTLLVNGARASDGYSVYANLPAQVVRIRLLNASGERVFNFGFSANIPFQIIASDGGLLNNPVPATRIRLSPGERSEILIDLSGMNGQSFYLMSYASELPMGVQGGPTMPMPGGPPMDSPLNGIDFNILQVSVVPSTSIPILTFPTSLTNNVPYSPSASTVTRIIRFTADSFMVMDGPFYFNGNSFDMMRIDYIIPVGNIEQWRLVNETMVAHPFHIHDVQFYLLDRGGLIPAPEEQGRKDVVLIPSGDSVLFITKFENYADSVVPYMYHCHILMHEDAGMMGQFLVVPPGYTGLGDGLIKPAIISVYPNPAISDFTLQIPNESIPFDIRIFETGGNVVISKNQELRKNINISTLHSGQYYLLIRQDGKYYSTQFIKP